MKSENQKIIRDAIAVLCHIPCDEGFSDETAELAKLINKLIKYSDSVKSPTPSEQKKPQPGK